jgi:thioredoxin-related protein
MTTENELNAADNLQQLGDEVKRSKRPLLLLFTQEHCDYCHRLKDEIFKPMMRNAADRERVLIREVSIDVGNEIVDFDGNSVEGFLIFKDYKLVVTPTALLVDSNGKQLGKPMLGANTLEMYGWYLDVAIDDARRILGGL